MSEKEEHEYESRTSFWFRIDIKGHDPMTSQVGSWPLMSIWNHSDVCDSYSCSSFSDKEDHSALTSCQRFVHKAAAFQCNRICMLHFFSDLGQVNIQSITPISSDSNTPLGKVTSIESVSENSPPASGNALTLDSANDAASQGITAT